MVMHDIVVSLPLSLSLKLSLSLSQPKDPSELRVWEGLWPCAPVSFSPSSPTQGPQRAQGPVWGHAGGLCQLRHVNAVGCPHPPAPPPMFTLWGAQLHGAVAHSLWPSSYGSFHTYGCHGPLCPNTR